VAITDTHFKLRAYTVSPGLFGGRGRTRSKYVPSGSLWSALVAASLLISPANQRKPSQLALSWSPFWTWFIGACWREIFVSRVSSHTSCKYLHVGEDWKVLEASGVESVALDCWVHHNVLLILCSPCAQPMSIVRICSPAQRLWFKYSAVQPSD
jgi:hypothetical protein